MGRVFRKYGADSERVWVLVAALLACLLALAVWLRPLGVRAVDFAIAALLIAALVALFKARRALGWIAALPIGVALCWLIPFPWSSVAAALPLAAFLALARLQIADALLPVRAYFIRRRAQKR